MASKWFSTCRRKSCSRRASRAKSMSRAHAPSIASTMPLLWRARTIWPAWARLPAARGLRLSPVGLTTLFSTALFLSEVGLTARCVRRGVMQHLVASKRYSRFSAPSTTSVEALWSGGKVWSVSKGVSPGLVGVSQRGLPQVPLPSRSHCTVAWRPSSLSLLLYGAAVARAAAPVVLRRAPAFRTHVLHCFYL